MGTRLITQAVQNIPLSVDRSTRQELVRMMEAEWKRGLFADTSGLNAATMEIIFQRAWSDGHAYGYAEVEGHFDENADLARAILRANA